MRPGAGAGAVRLALATTSLRALLLLSTWTLSACSGDTTLDRDGAAPPLLDGGRDGNLSDAEAPDAADALTTPISDGARPDAPTEDDTGTEREPPLAAEVGIIDTATMSEFVDLPVGGGIPIGGTGQAGLTARFGRKVWDPNGQQEPPSAVLSLMLTNTSNGVTAENKTFGEAVELECRMGVCYRVPVLVEISHVAKLPELEGTEVEIALTVLSPSGEVLARAGGSGVFERF